ncbi:MAG: neutral/alkaline non-lysosomal ceramidase N-terminal domain-containing protein [Planctomycetota bacterium]
MSEIKIGFAKTDITPQTQRQTIYHKRGTLDDAKTSVRDRLFARATAFRSNDEGAVWMTVDLLCVDTRLRNAVVAKLAAKGISPDHVALCATHTHTAPTVVPFHSIEATPAAYLRSLEEKMLEAALGALESAKPAEIHFGRSTVDLSVNRREIGRMAEINSINSPTGLVDPEVNTAVICMKDDMRTGLLFNYGAHPLTMSKRNPQISADYPGRAVEYLETKWEAAHAQFLQGCCGNANVKVHGEEQEAVMVGTWLAQAVLAGLSGATQSLSSDLRMATRTVRLPWGKMATAEAAAALATAHPNDKRTAEWADAIRHAYTSGPVADHAEVIVQAMHLGDAVFVALPGEVFLEIGLAIKKQAGVDHVFVVANANSCEIGYIPTAAAFPEGGYEIDSAPYYYGLFQLSPDCEEIIVGSALEAVKDVTA